MARVAKDKGAYGEGVTRFKVRFDINSMSELFPVFRTGWVIQAFVDGTCQFGDPLRLWPFLILLRGTVMQQHKMKSARC